MLSPMWRVALTLGVGLAGCALPSPAAAQPSSSAVKNWRLFSSKEGAFSALFPAAPKSGVRAEGSKKVHFFYHAIPRSAYMVTYADLREGGFSSRQIQRFQAQKMLDSNKVGLLKGARGVLVSERALQWQNFPAREVVYDIPQLGVRARSLLIYSPPFLYQVTAILPQKQASSPASLARVRAFFASFHTRAPRS